MQQTSKNRIKISENNDYPVRETTMSATSLNKNTEKRTIKVTLNAPDLGNISEIAKELGVTESEVLRKGLKLMAIYHETKKDDAKFVIENPKEKTRQELIII